MKIGSDVTSQPAAAVEEQRQAKLVDAAEQFEATMLQEGSADFYGVRAEAFN